MIEQLNLPSNREILFYDSSYGNIKYAPPKRDKIPFIVILHSLGKNENLSIKLSNILPQSSFVLSVRAPIEWRVDGDESFAWFDIKGPMIENFCQESDVINSIDYLIKIIEECKSKFDNLDEPIILGFSQGGIVGLTMAIEKYYPVKGVYCHCGYYETKLNENHNNIETNILMTNGINDGIIPSLWAQNSMDILKNKCNNFRGLFLECGHGINEEVINIMKSWLIEMI